jgi:hypothetical protein
MSLSLFTNTNSYFNSNPNPNSTYTSANAKDISEAFCKTYYTNLTNSGLSSVLYMFDPNVTCTLGLTSHVGAYKTLLTLSQININKFGYYDLNSTFQTRSDGSILISVTGKTYSVSFNGNYGTTSYFTETFILSHTGNNIYFITNHILKLL